MGQNVDGTLAASLRCAVPAGVWGLYSGTTARIGATQPQHLPSLVKINNINKYQQISLVDYWSLIWGKSNTIVEGTQQYTSIPESSGIAGSVPWWVHQQQDRGAKADMQLNTYAIMQLEAQWWLAILHKLHISSFWASVHPVCIQIQWTPRLLFWVLIKILFPLPPSPCKQVKKQLVSQNKHHSTVCSHFYHLSLVPHWYFVILPLGHPASPPFRALQCSMIFSY